MPKTAIRKLCLLVLCSLSSLLLKAQITGVVADSATGKPLENALVALLSPAAKDTLYYPADNRGMFTIGKWPSASCTLIFTAPGYAAVRQLIAPGNRSAPLSLGTILLPVRAQLLPEVVVETPPVVIREDTIEYRADAFPVKENAVTEDLLKKLPGIAVDRDGNVTAQGKQVTKVRVNGKDFFGGDVKSATRELPANIIDKVQVIDDYGDQATISGIREGDPEKVINLQLKKDKSKGVFGKATAGAGTADRYQLSGNANYFNQQRQISVLANSNNTSQALFSFGSMGMNRGMSNLMKQGQRMMSDFGGGSGLMNAVQSGDQAFLMAGMGNNNGISATHSAGMNYRDQWGRGLSVYGSYSFSRRINSTVQSSSTQQFFSGSSYLNDQQSGSRSTADNHRFFFNLEYQLDSFNYLKFSPVITYAGNAGDQENRFGLATVGGSKTSDGFTRVQSNTASPQFSGTLFYNHRFRKKGRNFSANLNLGRTTSDNDQETRNRTTRFVDPVGAFSQVQRILQDNRGHQYGLRLTYSEPLGKTRSLDLAVSHQLNHTGNNRSAYQEDPLTGTFTFLPFLSNHFENDFYTNRAGVSVRTTGKKHSYTLGLSLQPVSLQGRSVTADSAYRTIHRVNFFPIARYTYTVSKMESFNAAYSGNATQPGFSQLQDVLDISNPQLVTRGNPSLKPAVNHNLNLTYNRFSIVTGKLLFANLTLSTIRNQIVNNLVRLDSSGAQLSIPENVNGFYNVLGFYTWSKPFKKRKYVLTLTGNLNFNHNINLVDSIENTGRNWVASQGFIFEFNHKTWLQWGLGASYSLNDVRYSTPEGKPLSLLPNTRSSALTISSNIDLDLPHGWILKYDLDYTLNYGLNAAVTRNQAIFGASVEKQLFKKKTGSLKLAGIDLFNQNAAISRSVTGSQITDSRSNRLARYFMLSFTWRLQRFQGQRPATPGFRGMPENKNAEVKVF